MQKIKAYIKKMCKRSDGTRFLLFKKDVPFLDGNWKVEHVSDRLIRLKKE